MLDLTPSLHDLHTDAAGPFAGLADELPPDAGDVLAAMYADEPQPTEAEIEAMMQADEARRHAEAFGPDPLGRVAAVDAVIGALTLPPAA